MNKSFLKIFLILVFIYWLMFILQQVYPYRGVIGVTFQRDNDKNVYVSALADGMPAKEAGLQVNDIIIAIDDKSMDSKGLKSVSSKIKGEPNTVVNIIVNRDGKNLNFKVNRVKNKIRLLPI